MKKILFALAVQLLIAVSPFAVVESQGANTFLARNICLSTFREFHYQTELTYKGDIVVTQDGKLGMYSDTEGEYVIEMDNGQGLFYDTVYVASPGDFYGPTIVDTITSSEHALLSNYDIPENSILSGVNGSYVEQVGNDFEYKFTAYNLLEGSVVALIYPDPIIGACKTVKVTGSLRLVFSDSHYMCSNGNASNQQANQVQDIPVCGCDGINYREPMDAIFSAGLGGYFFGKCGEQKAIWMSDNYCPGMIYLENWGKNQDQLLVLNGKRIANPQKLSPGLYTGFYTYWNAGESAGYAWEGSFTVLSPLPTPELIYNPLTNELSAADGNPNLQWYEDSTATWGWGQDSALNISSSACDYYAEVFTMKANECFSDLGHINICDTSGPFNPFPTDSICAEETTTLNAGRGYTEYDWGFPNYNEPTITLMGYGWVKVKVLGNNGIWYSDSVYLEENMGLSIQVSDIRDHQVGSFIKLDESKYSGSETNGHGKFDNYEGQFGYFPVAEDYLIDSVYFRYSYINNDVCKTSMAYTSISKHIYTSIPSDCFDPALIDIDKGLATTGDPVCGCNGQTYPSADAARYLFGIQSVTPGACDNAVPLDKVLFTEQNICLPVGETAANVTAISGYDYYFWDTDEYLATNASSANVSLNIGGHSLVAMNAMGNKYRDSIYINASLHIPALILTDTIGWTDTASLAKLTGKNISIDSGYEGVLLSDQTILRYIPSADERLAGEALLTLLPNETLAACTTAANGAYRISIPAQKIVSETLFSNHSHCIPLGQSSMEAPAYGGFQYYFWDTEVFDLAHSSSRLQDLAPGKHSLIVIDYSGYRYRDSVSLISSYQHPALELQDTIKWADTLVLEKLTGKNISLGTDLKGILFDSEIPWRYLPSAQERSAGKAVLTLIPTETFSACTTAVAGSYEIIIEKLAELSVNLLSENPATPVSRDGAVWIATVSGEAPFSYEWSNGNTTDSIGGLRAGTYLVTVTDKFLRTSEHSVTLSPKISVLHSVSGRVVSGTVPVSGAQVYAFSGSSVTKAQTGTDGTFRFGEIIPGTYIFMASAEGYAPSFYSRNYLWDEAFPITVDADIVELSISLMPLLADSKGTSIVQGRLVLADADGRDSVFAQNGFGAGMPLALIQNGKTVATTITDNEGHYLFANIPSGEYQIIINKPGDVSAVTMVNVGDGEIKNVDLKAETATGIQYPVSADEIIIQPNPVNGFFSISGTDVHSLKLFSTLGNLVYKSEMQNTYFLPALPAGMYVLSVTSLTGMTEYCHLLVE